MRHPFRHCKLLLLRLEHRVALELPQRAIALGVFESFDCPGGERRSSEDAEGANPLQKDNLKRPPCLIAPPSMYNGKQFVGLEPGRAPFRRAPGFREGSTAAVDPNPSDPLD